MQLIIENKQQIKTLCEQHDVQSLYAFGSVLSNSFGKESDVDLLVQFREIDVMDYFDNYMDLKEKLENLFTRKVDLVENQAIRNPIFRRVIDREKQMIYERESTQMAL
jgi:uncharacterized protein